MKPLVWKVLMLEGEDRALLYSLRVMPSRALTIKVTLVNWWWLSSSMYSSRLTMACFSMVEASLLPDVDADAAADAAAALCWALAKDSPSVVGKEVTHELGSTQATENGWDIHMEMLGM